MSSVRASMRIYLYVFASLWVVALAAIFVQGCLLHKAYPYNTFLFRPEIHFTDFTIFDARFAIWDRSESFYAVPGFPFTYPAPLLACFLAYWKLTPHPLAAYLATVVLFAAAAAAMLVRRYPALRWPVLATLLGSYPLMFLLDRANIEGLVWIALATALFAFARRRFTTSAILFGVAAGMKIFPAALLLIFWKRRRYRYFPVGVASAIVCNIAGLAIAGPSIPKAFGHVLAGMDFFRHFEILTHRPDQIGFEHSLFSCIKQILHLALHSSQRTDELLPAMCLPYLAVTATIFAGLYIFSIRKLPVLNRIFALTACSISLPFVSYDYTLVHMYIPFAAFLIYLTTDVAAGRAVLPLRRALAFLIPCAVLFAPLSWMLFQGSGCGGQIKALALAALTAAAVKIPLPSSLFGDLRRGNARPAAAARIRIRETELAPVLS
jgi:hypothetical protein